MDPEPTCQYSIDAMGESSGIGDLYLEVEGEMITQNLQNKRQLTIQASNLRPIQEPKNPYEY